ncbi:MAG: hypothetical protein ACR2PO_09015 [Methyloligellaceae bacterium]
MAEPAKYLFDRDFDSTVAVQEAEREESERVLREQFEQELTKARHAAREVGYAEGEGAAAASLEARIADTLDALLERMHGAANNIHSECAVIRTDAITVARTISETLAGELVRQQPTTELEALFSECLEEMTHAPHIAVRVNDGLLEPLQKRLTECASERGFTGKLIVLGDPEIPIGDGRIEWADGGIARDMHDVSQRIDSAVRRHISPQKSGPVTTPTSPTGPDGPADVPTETHAERDCTEASGEIA